MTSGSELKKNEEKAKFETEKSFITKAIWK